jgi:streptogramin lyase
MDALKMTGCVALAACLGTLPAEAMPGKKQRAAEKQAAKALSRNAREARLAAMNRTLFGVPPPPEKAPKGGVAYVSGLDFQDGSHPFFKTYPIDRIGHFTFFCLEGEEGGQVEPRSLVSFRGGAVAWLSAKRDGVHRLSPTDGYRIIPWPKQAPVPEALVADDQDQLWIAGKGFQGRIKERKAFRDPVTGGAGFDLRILEAPGPSGFLQKLGAGTPWFHGPGGFVQYDDQARPSGMIPLLEPEAVQTATWDETRRAVYVIGPDMGSLHRASPCPSTCPPPGAWPLEPSGCRIHQIAADRAGMVWGTVPDQDALTVFNPHSQTWRTINLADELDRKALCPMGIDLGPDGNLWIALNQACAVLRVTPGEPLKFKCFPLLPGQAPTEIVRSGSGRMLVTLPGIGFGAMVALPDIPDTPEAPVPSEPSASSSSSSRPKPPKAPLSGQQRRELAHRRMLEACERQLRAAATPGYYDEMLGQGNGPAPATAPHLAESKKEGKGEAPKPAEPAFSAEAAQGYLLSRELFLTPVAIDHIHQRHGERHIDPSASEFQAPYRTPGGIQSLIAEGLGKVEDIEEHLRMDLRGRTYLLCTMPQAIGWCNGQPTRKFLVGTSRWYDAQSMTFQYEVITAYPVAPGTL